jgi:hypothetical protein
VRKLNKIKKDALVIKKILIDDKKPIFIDTNIYKYYVEYKNNYNNYKTNSHQIDLINSNKIFNFIIDHKIIVKENKMLEEEIKKIIKKSEIIEEKHYYEELRKNLNLDQEITEYSFKEENIAKEIAPRSKTKKMEQDFIIVICCKKDNTEIILTRDREDFKKCLSIYSQNKSRFENIDKEIILIPLARFSVIIDEINKIMEE